MTDSNNLGNKGLHNLGNTCYMNSVYQCLSHLTIFHPKNSEFINECDNISKDTMMYQWIMFQKICGFVKIQDAYIQIIY